MIESVRWQSGSLRVMDQSQLPKSEIYLDLKRLDEVVDSIKTLKVRGAPALGVVGAYGLCLGLMPSVGSSASEFKRHAESVANCLIQTRPTAVNLQAGVKHVLNTLLTSTLHETTEILDAMLQSAHQFLADDIDRCSRMVNHGTGLIPPNGRVLTHCNTGGLATGGVGTALGIVVECARRGTDVHVYVDETRPLLQGARLTTWELKKFGVKHTLICDNAAGHLIASGRVDCVIVGADRIAANGDTANKIGTYPLAVLSQKHRIPFYVAAPFTTVDRMMPSGEQIVIEERNGNELSSGYVAPPYPDDTPVYNPAFDVTPGSMISAIITEYGVSRGPVYDFSKFN